MSNLKGGEHIDLLLSGCAIKIMVAPAIRQISG